MTCNPVTAITGYGFILKLFRGKRHLVNTLVATTIIIIDSTPPHHHHHHHQYRVQPRESLLGFVRLPFSSYIFSPPVKKVYLDVGPFVME
ncbi:hypothetical protein DAPPUDRAFT_233713 [Daphnia pulex]|uniref:Uncharacterized protein n=1 Tax=Daphnia pulex TaxID=6669 RepID=E9FVJ1_DAPPU|nr:hypothetical protein DAPPUDRAFT_233713 [Daphnia pulex]|eukprot:EFX88562.1 hypothetical protein DAPPUDRAFT_233713 [Daphnia pulex]